MDNKTFVIAGLGNPGDRFNNTKHNVGFDVIDSISSKFNIPLSKTKFKALIGDGTIDGKKVVLVKPQTYMNLSGESIIEVISWYKVSSQNIILIYDDIDLELGMLRIRAKGSAGTHNGMKSVVFNLKTDIFPRIRIGIGKPPKNWDLADYVLSKFNDNEKVILNTVYDNSVNAINSIIGEGIDIAMSKFNVKTI